jgi:hypothetical protein
MYFTNVMLGTTGHAACGFARSTINSQLAFWLGRSISRDASPARDIPVYDAELKDAMGDVGLPTIHPLNTNVIVSGYAASFLLLSKHIQTPHPETGRKDEHLMRFLKNPRDVVAEAFKFNLSRQITQTRATAEMVNGDPTARIEALTQEAAKQILTFTAPVMAAFIKAVEGLRDEDTDKLVDIACEALIDCGRDPAVEIKRSAVAFLESQKKRLESGEFVAVDAGIYALAQ